MPYMSTAETKNTLFRRSGQWIILFFALFLIAAAGWGYYNYRSLVYSMEGYSACQTAGIDMQEASDYLTEQVRHFAMTGDPVYMENYFTEAKETRRRDKAVNDLGIYYNGTDALNDLIKSFSESVELMNTEYYSMRLVCEAKELDPGSWPEEVKAVQLSAEDSRLPADKKLEKARDILLDINYHDLKESINSDSKKCTTELMAETQKLSDHYNRLFIIIYAVMVCSLLGVSVLSLILLRAKNSLEDYQTDLVLAKEAAEASSAAKTRFLFNMSHDIRTPLNAVRGFSELLEKHRYNDDQFFHDLAGIRTSGGYLMDIINNVLEMARIENGKLEPVEVPVDPAEMNKCIESVFHSDFETKRLKYSYKCSDSMRPVYTDPTMVSKAILNVIGNAVKYTPEGGSIGFELIQTETEPGWCDMEVIISDTGIGMSKEFAEHAFEAFERERNSTESGIKGTGLGLGIVKGIIDCLNGSISIDSETGVGTTVTMHIPQRLAETAEAAEVNADSDSAVGHSKNAESAAAQGVNSSRGTSYGRADDAAADSQGNAAENTAKGSPGSNAENTAKGSGRTASGIPDLTGKRILLAEDNDINAEIAMEIIEDTGAVIDRAEDGAICVEMLKNAEAGYYDLVLMDIQMPNLNGLDAARQIRALDDKDKAGIMIYAITANAFEEDRQNALNAGMNGFIAKPLDIALLMDNLARI